MKESFLPTHDFFLPYERSLVFLARDLPFYPLQEHRVNYFAGRHLLVAHISQIRLSENTQDLSLVTLLSLNQ